MKMMMKVENKLNESVNDMNINLTEIIKGAVDDIEPQNVWGRVSGINSGVIHVSGLQDHARIGDRLTIKGDIASSGEVIAIKSGDIMAMPDASTVGMSPGDQVCLAREKNVRPSAAWIGGVLNSDGNYFDGTPTPKGERAMSLLATTEAPTDRRSLGERLKTGLAPFDTFLPICKGQRIGLFAGSGVGKSSLLGDLAKGVKADVVIVALIGERSREVRDFVDETLGEEGRKRTIVFASTCDEPAPSKRRCALLAITAAEYFRDQGLHVLLLFDSLTRYADAHREIALTAGETPSLRAYPPSTFRAIASLAERTGPGVEGAGDITAIFSILVAGSDMDEPVADMVRSILDGHVVLDREIAERGRFPAVNIRRSVSRSLPKAANKDENALLADGRKLIATYDEATAMIQTGLYAAGSDPAIDRAISVWPKLEEFVTEKSDSCEESYENLQAILSDQRLS
ncbi:MAG: ATP synthase [Hyphococcus sp.]|nr:MAG: ATP synthase [Marinicaulis sp.]